MSQEKVKFVYESFGGVLSVPVDHIPLIGNTISIPFFDEEILNPFLDEILLGISSSQPLIEVNKPVVIVGDLHGNFHDLLRILKLNGSPENTRYLFLGDYVDRGEFSLEVITLLLCLREMFPENIFLIRGNHETRETNQFYGFKTDIQYLYHNDSIWEKFNDIFDYLPLAAIIKSKIFCVHGGLSPFLTSLSEIRDIQFPLKTLTPLVSDLLWSDPTDFTNNFIRESDRGIGCLFGRAASQRFLQANGLETLIRGHECISEGVQSMHNKTCITVFSSSNYELSKNIAAYLKCNKKCKLSEHTLEQIKRIKRRKCKFESITKQDVDETFGFVDLIHSLLNFFTNKLIPA